MTDGRQEFQVSEDDAVKTVYVTNVSASATEESLREFFAFCGPITRIEYKLDQGSPDGCLHAICTFDGADAAKTALYLTNAVYLNGTIAVTPFAGDAAPASTLYPPTEDAPAPPSYADATGGSGGASADGSKSDGGSSSGGARAKLAGLMAAGAFFAGKALDKAKEFDEQHQITPFVQDVVKTTVDGTKTIASDVDQRLKISEKVSEFDRKHQVSTKTAVAVGVVKMKTEELKNKALENPSVVAGLEKTKQVASKLEAEAEALRREAEAKLEARRSRELVPSADAGDAADDDTLATTADATQGVDGDAASSPTENEAL